jgi:serralysin
MQIKVRYLWVWAMASLLLLRSTSASFHLWEISEVYSNPSGSLQYVEMHNDSFGENFLDNFHINGFGSGATRVFTFPFGTSTTLGSNTANKNLLIATPNFESATGVKPDFTFSSANFLYLTGSVQFDGSGATVAYSSSAWDGTHAVNDSGQQVDPSPTNFTGQTATVPEPGSTALLLISALVLKSRRPR